MDRERIGPYRFIRMLGKGGMGTVFEAVHEAIERRVAIKILHPEMAANPEHAARFLNEARAANRIDHPGIVEIHDFDSLPDGTTFLVMEFLAGETLHKRFHRQGKQLGLGEVLWVGREVASAISAAHSKGIIHRDLKPDNIMVVSDPDCARGERLKLLDFGIAKVAALSGKSEAVTQVGTVMGTLFYISPEQLRNTAQVDDRADVYSLGAMLYHLLAGHPPFQVNSDIELVAKHLLEAPRPLREVAPGAPEPLCTLIDTMLAKEPQARPAMAEVAQRFAELQEDVAEADGALAAAEGRAVAPRTLARRSGSLREGGRAAPTPGSDAAGASLPSASTVSGAASESLLFSRSRARPRRWLTVSTVSVLAIWGAIGGSILYSRSRGKTTVRTAAVAPVVKPEVSVRAQPPPTPTPPLQPPTPTPRQDTAGATGDAQLASGQPASVGSPQADQQQTKKTAAPSGRPRHGDACQRVIVSRSCLTRQNTPLSADIQRAIVEAARSSSLRVCRGQTLRMVRAGSRMIFDSKAAVAPGEVDSFSGTLRGLLAPGQGLPSEVTVKCSN
ncbi:MAG TPA: serine/threonine-protein kinase [Pseudomonadota bacterium]|nr:serine/threonine-protein kinase [Pseudomonadota bacterium]